MHADAQTPTAHVHPADAPAAQATRVDERKLVTMLFADVVESTSLAEGLDPERLQRLLAAYFGSATLRPCNVSAKNGREGQIWDSWRRLAG